MPDIPSTMRAAVENAMHRRTLESEIHTNAEKLQQLLSELHAEGQTLVIVTHDEHVAARADRVRRLVDGRLTEQ